MDYSNEVESFPYYGGEQLHVVDLSLVGSVKVERRQGVSKFTMKPYDFYVVNAYIDVPNFDKPLVISVETPRQNDLTPLYFNNCSLVYVEPTKTYPKGRFAVLCRSVDDSQKVHFAGFKTFNWANGKKEYDYEKTQTLTCLLRVLCDIKGVNL